MQVEKNDILSDVFRSVLEKVAFMFADPVEREDLPEVEGKCLEAQIEFAGAMSGSLTLRAPAAICGEISANILGVEKDDISDAGQVDDAFKEVLNITCGNLVTAMAGEKAVFDLTPPVVRGINLEEWEKSVEDKNTLIFDVDSSPVLLSLHMKG